MKRIREIPSFVYDPSCAFYVPLWKRDAKDGDSFISDDAYGHLLTVTGATWGIQGRDFVTDDVISKTITDFRIEDSTGSIGLWFKSSYTANYQYIFASSDTATTTSIIGVYTDITTGVLVVRQVNAGGTVSQVAGTTGVCDGKFHYATISSNGTAYSISLDNIPESLVVQSGSNTGDWFADTTLRDNITIGARTHTSTGLYFNGTIGELFIASRNLTAQELQQIYLSTKWRFV